MKRKLSFLIAAALLSILPFAFAACNKTEVKTKPDNISRQTDAYYAGENADFAVSIEFGKSEKPFIADGKCAGAENFVRLTVTPLIKNDFEKIGYSVFASDSEFSGELTAGDRGDFWDDIALNFSPEKITLVAGDSNCEIQLKNVLDGALSAADAVNIAKAEFAEKIAAEKEEGKQDREIYMKLITGDRKDYFYYVSFIGEGADYWALLLNPQSGEVITKK